MSDKDTENKTPATFSVELHGFSPGKIVANFDKPPAPGGLTICMPSLSDQKAFIFQMATNEAVSILLANLDAPRKEPQSKVDESQFGNQHLLREGEGWSHPDCKLVKAYFEHFQDNFPEYSTDAKLAILLGLKSGDRRIRAFKDGSRNVPYGIWRRFLVMTGRVPQDVLKVLAYMG